MKTYNLILITLFSILSLTVKSQIRLETSQQRDVFQINQNVSFLGEPRKQLKTSFYNIELQSGDWLRNFTPFKQKKLTFLGVENKVKTNGKTIVIDASEKATIKNIVLKGTDNIVVEKNKIFVEKDNRLYQIPITYTGDNTVNVENFSIKDKAKLCNYIIESFKYSGSTPSNIEVKAFNKDYDLFIFKSSFIPEDISIKRVNMRTTQIFKIEENVYYVMN